MMFTPMTSKHFQPYTDPVSGICIYTLSTRVAPIQQGFYFVNSSWSDDGRYLWFYCAFPPAPAHHSVAVIDFLTDEIHWFPETWLQNGGASWYIEPDTGNLFWGNSEGIYMRTPNPKDRAVCIAKIPESISKTNVRSFATHLTFTPNGEEILADMQTQTGSYIGTFNVKTGKYQQWYETRLGIPYNHAQMSPVDNDICMCAHEMYMDPIKGRINPPLENGVYPRIQIINRAGKRQTIKPIGNYATHEFWAPNGQSVYYCNGGYIENGSKVSVVARNRLDGSAAEIVCRLPVEDNVENCTWHTHCTKDEKYFVMDGSYQCMGKNWWRGVESFLHFYNTQTGKKIKFLTKNPIVEGWSPENQCPYHIDPHPRFVLNDSMITFTTTVRGKVDLAVVCVDQLLKATL